MRILIVHNMYQRHGGEDAVVAAEIRMLRARGHRIVRYLRHNDELRERGPLSVIRAGFETVWAANSYTELRGVIEEHKPDVAHFHNTFPLISPSAYYACAEAGVPVLQTLHNYRLLCPGAALQRDGKVCQECLGRSVAWPGISHGCYRGNPAATAAVAAMLATHRALGTWRDKITVYIALSEFARQKFIEGGLPAERIAVKPNFVSPDPGRKRGQGDYALFIGRLSEEKGLRVLLNAWRQLDLDIPLRIAGDGPLHTELLETLSSNNAQGCTLLGPLSGDGVREAMHGARFLIVPSVWFEGFPVTIAESFACGLPVIASRLGSLAEIVADGRTGLHFSAGNAQELAAKVKWAWTHPRDLEYMGQNARMEYEAKYTADINYRYLLNLWDRLNIHAKAA